MLPRTVAVQRCADRTDVNPGLCSLTEARKLREQLLVDRCLGSNGTASTASASMPVWVSADASENLVCAIDEFPVYDVATDEYRCVTAAYPLCCAGGGIVPSQAPQCLPAGTTDGSAIPWGGVGAGIGVAVVGFVFPPLLSHRTGDG